jgi:hypothetical protein
MFYGVNPGSMPGQGLKAILGILAKAEEMYSNIIYYNKQYVIVNNPRYSIT